MLPPLLADCLGCSPDSCLPKGINQSDSADRNSRAVVSNTPVAVLGNVLFNPLRYTRLSGGQCGSWSKCVHRAIYRCRLTSTKPGGRPERPEKVPLPPAILARQSRSGHMGRCSRASPGSGPCRAGGEFHGGTHAVAARRKQYTWSRRAGGASGIKPYPRPG